MKNIKEQIKTIGLIMVVTLITLIVTQTNTASSNTNNSTETIRLQHENYELRMSLSKLQNEIINIENTIIKINEIDNNLYSQIMDESNDSINLIKYDDYDTINYIINNYSVIINKLDERVKNASELANLRLNRLTDKSNAIKKNNTILDYYPRLSPIKINDFVCISSEFGWRYHPIYKKLIFHEGVDISARLGTKVYASASGKVDKVVYSKCGYGNCIIIKHTYGYETLYAHLGTVLVKKGEIIKIGQLIGSVGSTGLSTGTHLHYEVHLNDNYEDPLAYFYSDITNDLIVDIKK